MLKNAYKELGAFQNIDPADKKQLHAQKARGRTSSLPKTQKAK